MKEILKLGLTLFLVTLIAAVVLAFTNQMTNPVIMEQRAIKEEKAKKDVFPSADSFEEVSEGFKDTIVVSGNISVPINSVFKCLAGGAEAGYIIKTLPKGYGGEVEVLVGVDLDGNTTGVRIGTHQETPGLGAKATDAEFYVQYDGKIAAETSVTKQVPNDTEIQAITGATITSRAVTNGVNAAAIVTAALAE